MKSLVPRSFRYTKGVGSLALLAVLGLLSACQQTRFEALPSGTYSECDPDWVGGWRIESTDPSKEKDEGPVYWIVDANCVRYQTMEADGASEDEHEFSIRYVKQDSRKYLVNAKPNLAEDASDWDKGFMLIRYDWNGANTIRLFEVDNQQVAQLILDGEIAGHSEVKTGTDRNGKNKIDSIENLLAGPTTNTDKVIQRKGVFKRKPWLILHRVSSDEIAKMRAKFLDQRNPESG